jgi:hypothetical protein
MNVQAHRGANIPLSGVPYDGWVETYMWERFYEGLRDNWTCVRDTGRLYRGMSCVTRQL